MNEARFTSLESFEDLKAYAESKGSHFFEPAAMRFFRSRLIDTPRQTTDGKVFFVTSERESIRSASPRLYAVRCYHVANNFFETIDRLPSRTQAISIAKKLAKAEIG